MAETSFTHNPLQERQHFHKYMRYANHFHQWIIGDNQIFYLHILESSQLINVINLQRA